MSVAQKNLPQGTRTSVLDHLFMSKYHLTYSETIMMSYILLVSSWATKIDEDYYLLLSCKIEKDLPLGEKTIEAIFTKLKKLKLIETKRILIKKWSQTQTYRGIRVTDLGKEYNLSYHKPEEYQYINTIKEQLEDAQAKNEYMQRIQLEIKEKNVAIKEENTILTLQLQGRDLFLESNEKTTQKAQDIINNQENLSDKIATLEKELKEAKEIIKAKEEALSKKCDTTVTKIEAPISIEKDLSKFRKKILKEYGNSANILCNGVPNWGHNVNFYINSYSKVTIKLLTGEFQQLTNIDELSSFWKWLFENQERVGQIIKKPIDPKVLELMGYEGKTFTQNDKSYTIIKIEAVESGVTLLIQNKENLKEGYLTHSNAQRTFGIAQAIGALKEYIL